MKLLIILFVLASLQVSAIYSFNQDDYVAWMDYKTKYGKNYTNEAEDALRMQIFLENRQFVMSFNMKSEVSFTQGINDLSDLTQEEINRSRNGFRLLEAPERQLGELLWPLLVNLNRTISSQTTDKAWYENYFSPENLDYRLDGRVSKVKNQGSCGSCWSFAATGALESILASQGKATLLSEQNLVDCSRKYGNYGCNGGLMNQAFSYIRDHGIMSEKDYPYTGKDEVCKFVKEKSVASVRGSLVLPSGNEPLLRMVLAISGPLPVAIDASSKTFHNYKSGIYNDHSCHSDMNHLNHAVLLVGYGTDPKYGDYWIIKNSWGTNWGDRGYIKISRNSRNLCGVATFAVLPIP